MTFGGFGDGDGKFGDLGYNMRMHCDSTGNVYIVDQAQGRVQVFDNDCNFLRNWNALSASSGWMDCNLENGKYYTGGSGTLNEYDLYGNLLQQYYYPPHDGSSGENRLLVFNNRVFTVSFYYHWANIFEFSENEPPTANAGPDQVIFDSVTLDGSGSSDSDGTIASWEWTLTHRTNSSFNRAASGEKPTVSNLAAGFYDVVLMVTDDSGATDTDSMLLGAAGIWDINGDGKLGLSETIYILQILSGVRP